MANRGSATAKSTIDDEELTVLVAEAKKTLDEPAFRGLQELVRTFHAARQADDLKMQKELDALKKKYQKKVIDGRRRAVRKALLRSHRQIDEKKTKAEIARIKARLGEMKYGKD